jgi:hypothetical protein
MSDWLVDNQIFYNNALFFIHYFEWITQIIVILFVIGVFTNKPAVFLTVNFIVKIFLAMYLIYRFNSYRKDKLVVTDLDRKICYSAGVYILVFSFFDVIQSYVERLRKLIDPYIATITSYYYNKSS